MAWLHLRRGGLEVLRYRLPAAHAGGQVVVGRGDTSDIALPSDVVSRVHAVFERVDGAWWVEDRSRHGTFRDGRRISREALDGDVTLRIGEYDLAFTEASAAREATVMVAAAGFEEVVGTDAGRMHVRRARALILGGGNEGRRVELKASRCTVGGLGATVVVEPSLQTDAAILHVVRGRVMVEPGSQPVFLEGEPVFVRTPVLEGETIAVGGVQVEIQSDVRVHGVDGPERFGDLVGSTPVMRQLFGLLDRVARHQAPVLLVGESGTGKELAAQAVHEASPRAEGPLVVVNCGAIPPTLVESHLFGHERGAFTGADRRRDGAFQEAHKGTLFLDELGELPLDVQARLLRALESGEVRRVGGSRAEYPDVRVVAATHRNLPDMVAAGTFRQDLFYRLAVLTARMPALREHRVDIPDLARALLRRHHPGATLTEEAERALMVWSWPGNVRELRNVLTRAVVLGGSRIDAGSLSFDPWSASPGGPTSSAGGAPAPLAAADAGADLPRSAAEASARQDEIDRRAVLDALARASFNRSAAARLLGIPRSSLIYRMMRLGIEG
jgi:DNA-binding NtrC family response regulator